MADPLFRIVFMGTPAFAVPSLFALAKAGMKPVLTVSQPDKPLGRKRIVVPTPVHQASIDLGIPSIQPTKVRNQAFLDAITEARPDFIVTAAYGRILTNEVLAVPRLAAVNVHGSLLPKYRGASPVQAALLHGDKITGVSIPLMTEKMDQGPVYRQAEFLIPDGMRADGLMLALADLGAAILPETLLAIASGLRPVPQDESLASYVSLLAKEDGLISWTESALRIEGQIRGLYPWPKAQAVLEGRKLMLLQGKAFPQLPVPLGLAVLLDQVKPGTLLSTADKKLWIQTGDGILCVSELQFAGSKALPTSECAHNFRPGQVLEDGQV